MPERLPASLPPAFVTYGWCRVSYAIVHSLARRGVEVHVGDIAPDAMCRYSRKVARFWRHRSPVEDPDGFLDDLVAALDGSGARVLLPGHEDALFLAANRERLPEGVELPVADAQIVDRLRNKWEALEHARSAGIPVPATYRAELSTNGETLNASVAFPAIVKPQIGNSAKGVFIVSSPAECSEKIGFLRSRYGLDGDRGPIVQEYVEGPGYGVCVLFCHGELRAAFCERYLLSKEGRLGTSVLRESVERPDLVEHARTLLEPLGWHGVAHLDFIHDEERDRQVLIEVNPRFWGALDLAVAAGVDFPWLLYRMALEGDVDLVTEYRLGVRSRWLVGELIHLVHAARMEGLSGIGSAFWGMLRRRAQSHDDFRWSDPVPLFAEMLYYGRRFARSGSTNPIDVGMIG